jgi:hypothetical protein
MAFLGEEVDEAYTTQKIRGESSSISGFTPTAATLHVHAKSAGPARKPLKGKNHFVHSVIFASIGLMTV